MSIWNKEEKLVDGKVIKEGKTILLRKYRVRKQTLEQITEEAVVGEDDWMASPTAQRPKSPDPASQETVAWERLPTLSW